MARSLIAKTVLCFGILMVGGCSYDTNADGARQVTTFSNVGIQTATVKRVIDGDTFEIFGGERVRVLGIDACERGTRGWFTGRNFARAQLENHPVKLLREPGVDTDKYGRSLRYVQLPRGTDFGELAVKRRDIGVYPGRNDASDEYIQRLLGLDNNGRTC